MASALVSIVIPVYNEEQILEQAIHELFQNLEQFKERFCFEIVLAENGSTDNTLELGKQLAKQYKNLSIFHYPEPDYGLALKEGIVRTKGEFVVCDEIDLCLADYYCRALEIFWNAEAEMVVGSKTMSGSHDKRPWSRRFATKVLNLMLRVALRFKGSDTHGIKAFKKEALMPVLHKCKIGRDMFTSEFIIRAERAGIKIREIPIDLEEKRPPAIGLARRIPKVLTSVLYLFWIIRIRHR